MRYNSLFKRISLLMLVLLYAVSGVLAQATKPPVVEFTKALTDTVYSVGPYVFEAKVASRSGYAIKRPWLHYTATLNNVTTHDSIYMTSLGSDSMWTATIPRHVYGTSFVYWIRGYDTLGNSTRDTGTFVSQFNSSGTVILNGDSVLYGGTSTGIQNCSFPFMLAGASPNWVRVLYMSNHVRPNKNGGCIGAMGFYTTYNAVNTHNNVKIYLKATTITSLTAISSSTIDPIKDGATLVYQGTITGKTGWNQYKFDRGFVLPAGMNLLWYVVDDDVNNPCNSTILYWMRNSGVGYNAVDHIGMFSCSGNSTGTVTDLPTTMFYFGRMSSGNPDTNSVAMESIDNPTEGTIAGKQPVKVTIINKGVGNLTYAKVSWSVNGVLQTPFTYKGNLPCDFTDTITLGSYTQKLMGYDTITVWVSDPNNKVDSVLEDDTLTVIAFGCDSLLKGTYTVGKGGKYNFPSLADALKILETCGWGGDVTLKIATGTYAENLIFKDFQTPNGYRLTITSIAGVADSVVFKPTSGVVADFASTSGLTFKYIKLDATNIANYCVQMGSGLKDIEFYHCILQGYKSTTTGNSHSVIYKASGAAVSDIRFIGNQILNGNYGIYFYGGGTTSKNSRIVFDSNYIAGYYYYAAYFYYNKMRFTHNTIEELSNIYSSYDYGMYCYYLDSSLIDANRFITHNHASYQYSLRTYYTDSATWITNNEIIMENSKTTSYGLYIYYTYGTKVINNSVLQYGNASTCYGMYVYTGSTTYYGEIKNNLVTCLSTGTTYPLYATSTTAANNYDFDYNCWWSPSYVGYVGSAMNSLTALQNALPSAKHDIFQRPVFRDTTKSLALRLATGMDCPKIAGVDRDLKGEVRVALTTRGAYAMKPVPCNGTLISFLNVPSKTDAGDTIRPSVILSNSGTDTITEATIRVELNGVATGKDIQWKGKIGLGQSDNVSLGTFILKGGDNVFTAYIVKLGNMKDTINDDDTTSISTHTCVQSFAGNYTVGGANPDFKDIEEAILALTSCGVTGPVTLKIRSGQYDAISIYGKVLGASKNNTITLMADSNAKVVIDGGAGTSLSLQHSGHWHFRNLTIGNTKDGRIGVELQGQVEDVSFRNCNIYASTTTTSSDYKAVNYPNSSGASYYPVDLEFVGNHIQGGYYNMYLYYLAGGTGNMTASSITVDSNVLTDAYYYGIYSYYYSHYKSLSYNTVTNRKNCSNIYYGIYQYYYSNVDRVEGNRVHINNENTAYGIYWYYYKNYASYGGTPGVFKNNEVILLGTTGAKYGIYFNMPYQSWEIVHNSVYAQTGSSTVYGIYLYNSNTSYMETFKNNLIVTKGSSTNYPIYLASYYTSSYVTLDYNNYFNQSGTYIGYAGSAISTLTSWQNTTGQEVNTTNVRPDFKDTTVSLELNDYTPFICPRLSSALYDINGDRRTYFTTMGVYGLKFHENVNLQATAFISPKPIADVVCYADYTPIAIEVKNSGLKDADFTHSPLRVSLDITGAINYHFDTTYTRGGIRMQETDTLILPTVPTIASGIYNMKITLNDTSDNVLEDDTISLAYNASRVELPYDIDFSTVPNEFVNSTLAGNTAWKVSKGNGSNPSIAPAFGTGRLEFASTGNPGSYAHAIFNAVNIQNCVNPTLSFWFAHNADCTGADMLTVLVTTDGGANYTEVKRILVVDTVTAWKQYDIDLSAFTKSSCLSVVFRAMSFGSTDQYIDRIRITADQDAAISLLPIDINSRTACDETPVDIKAVITNLSRLNIDMVNDTLTLNVTGAVNYSNKVVYNNRLGSFEADTVTLGQISLDANGAYYFEAFMQPFDDKTVNDTITDSTLFIMQDIALDTVLGLDDHMFKMTGDTVNVTAVAVNNGNIFVNKVILHMSIDGNNIVTDTVLTQLGAGDTLFHPMSIPFTVPAVSKEQPFYFFEMKTELGCDADNTNDVINIVGQVLIPDSIDIQVLDITATTPATGKTKLSPTVTVANIGNIEADNIVIHVDVINDSNRVVESISENISHMAVNETNKHAFTMNYKVPNYTGKYTLKAYVEAFDGDTIQNNDTLSKEFACYRDSVGIREVTELDWSLGQNIPNPATEVTTIPFTLPQDGRVRLSIMSANGQVIYSKEVDAIAGGNRIELDASGWTSGLYYYSMEFRGQRITRKMTVTR